MNIDYIIENIGVIPLSLFLHFFFSTKSFVLFYLVGFAILAFTHAYCYFEKNHGEIFFLNNPNFLIKKMFTFYVPTFICFVFITSLILSLFLYGFERSDYFDVRNLDTDYYHSILFFFLGYPIFISSILLIFPQQNFDHSKNKLYAIFQAGSLSFSIMTLYIFLLYKVVPPILGGTDGL